MTTDIRDARFYVIDESAGQPAGNVSPLGFDEAFEAAQRLAAGGAHVRVLYTEEASQTEITRFVSHGIPTELVTGG